MRIVLTSAHCWPDVRRGGERYVHELAAALRRAGHDVRIVSTGSPPRRDVVLDVPVRRLRRRAAPGRYPDPWSDLAVETAFGAQSFASLAAPALAGRFDVWHATSTGDGAAAAVTGVMAHRVGRRLRTVFTEHGFPARRSRDARPDRRSHGVVVRHIDHYVCVSRAAGDHLLRDYGRPADVVPPGVQLDAHRAATRHPTPALLYAGSLTEPRKGIPLLLEAVATLRREHADAELWLLGQGDVSGALAQAPAQARTAVTRCGPVTDVELRTAYATAWVTVLPSRAESFGMTVVESLASGTPAVVLRDGGGPSEIVNSPAIGQTADATADDLARACGEALELVRRPSTVEACRARAADYDWDTVVVPALERIYTLDR